jgi:fluoride ion exporter CrcB/FEX
MRQAFIVGLGGFIGSIGRYTLVLWRSPDRVSPALHSDLKIKQ